MNCIPNNDINDTNGYKEWRDFCLLQKWSNEQILMIEENHRHRLSAVVAGMIDLTPTDAQALHSMLLNNRGSKEMIKTVRLWILDRSHSIIAIGFILANYIRNQIDPATANVDCTMVFTNGYNSHQPFTHMLHTIYLINDVFFNCQASNMKGPYTKIIPTLHDQPVNVINHLFSQLPWIFYATFKMAKSDADQEKCKKIVSIWSSKAFLDEARANILNSVMKKESLNIPEPFKPPLVSPFPFNLPSPNAFPIPPRPELLGLKAPAPPTLMAPAPPKLMAPVPPALMAQVPMPHPTIDLYQVSVGNMSNVLKNAFRGGHLRYHPIDLKSSPVLLPPGQMEPARKEARIQDFYKNVEMIIGNVNDFDREVQHRGIGHR